MGQYHKLANLTRREVVDPHVMGSGLKAREIVGSTGTREALAYLLFCPEPRGGGDFPASPFMGRWHGDRVAFVGDYSSADDLAGEGVGAYSVAEGWRDISAELRADMEAQGDVTFNKSWAAA